MSRKQRPRAEAVALHPGRALELSIEKGVYRGLGLARHEGQVVFVPRALPGDVVRARVQTVRPGYVRAALEEVVRPGPGRRTPPCPFAPACGGCAYQGMEAAAQGGMKTAILRETLERSGVPWSGEVAFHASPETGWRMRATFHVDATGGAVRVGLHEEGSHRVVDLDACLQIGEAMNRTLHALRRALGERPDRARLVRDLALAESIDGTQLVATLVTSATSADALAFSSMGDAVPWATGFAAVTADDRFLLLRGDASLESTVAGIAFRAHARSFFQGNRFLVDPLVDEVRRAVPPGGRVLDLYAGVGLFALPLARKAASVEAFEVSAQAVDDAELNARRAGLANVRLHTGDVLEGLRSCPAEAGETIVLDPPRTGAGREVMDALVARAPAVIVYVSCDPPTLARDLRRLREAGYVPQAITVFDLFPDTFHMETVVRIARV